MRQGSVLAYQAPEGWGGRGEGEMEETEICCSQEVRLFSWVLSVFFFPFFCCGWGTTMSKWMRGLVSRGVCEHV